MSDRPYNYFKICSIRSISLRLLQPYLIHFFVRIVLVDRTRNRDLFSISITVHSALLFCRWIFGLVIPEYLACVVLFLYSYRSFFSNPMQLFTDLFFSRLLLPEIWNRLLLRFVFSPDVRTGVVCLFLFGRSSADDKVWVLLFAFLVGVPSSVVIYSRCLLMSGSFWLVFQSMFLFCSYLNVRLYSSYNQCFVSFN